MSRTVTRLPRPRTLRASLWNAGLCPLLVLSLFAGCDDALEGEIFSAQLLETPVLLTGVIIGVGDRGEQALGDLKLRSTGAFNATARVNEATSTLDFVGCRENCAPGAAETRLVSIPVLDRSETELRLDLMAMGGHLRLSSILDDERYTVLSTLTRRIESTETLFIFDIESVVEREDGEGVKLQFPVATRWTLTRPLALHDDFREQSPRTDIGLLTTTRAVEPKTRRWHLDEPLHFYIKAVPAAHHAAFRAGLEDWNTLARETIGRDVVSYEFIPPDDPRATTLITGDIRANVIEWDLNNVASYGGIAASRADQRTGEVFSSSILVQGPGILRLYRDWFDIEPLADTESRERSLLGLRRLAEPVSAIAAPPKLTFGELELEGDRGCSRMEDRVTYFFEDRPIDVSFDDYMFGYFRSMVSHEVGHALGFAHNFMGSLVDDGAENPSSTTMEYVWRGARYRRALGAYDSAALRFAYGRPPIQDVSPDEVPPYCIHEVSPSHPERNAECSPWDGQRDPFGYFVARVRRAVERGIRAEAVGEAPLWSVSDLRGPLYQGLFGALFYATSAPTFGDQWLRFHVHPDRPTDPGAIQQYVFEAVEAEMCGPWVSQHIEDSFALNDDAGLAAARTWAALIQALEAAYGALEIAGPSCDPREQLSFDF